MTSELGADGIDGAWWPYTSSVARELPDLLDALGDRFGRILEVGVNWSAVDGVLDLNAMTRRGIDALPGWKSRHQRVLTVTGSNARANLLVVPSRTTTALAVMVLRLAAALPILPNHVDTAAYRSADNIVRSARAEFAQRAGLADSSASQGASASS